MGRRMQARQRDHAGSGSSRRAAEQPSVADLAGDALRGGPRMEQPVAGGSLRNLVVYGLFLIAAAAVGAYVGVSVDHQQNKPPTPALLFREERVPADGL